MKKHSYKEIERKRREDDILTVAEHLLIERGYANLNMDDLANEVGISKPTLYQHFKGKDEIAVRVLMRSYLSMDEFVSSPLDEPAINRIIAMIHRSLTIHAPGSIIASIRGDMRPESLWKIMKDHPTLAARRQGFSQNLYKLVDKAKEEGHIDSSIPTPIVTHMMFSLGRAISDPIIKAEYASDPNWLDRAIDSVIRVFLHGVTPLAGTQTGYQSVEKEPHKAVSA